MLLFAAYLSELVNSRVIATVFLQIWALPLLIALYTFDKATSQWVYFAVVTLITGFPYVHPLSPNFIHRAVERSIDVFLQSRVQVAWASRNSNSVRTRTVSASAYNMFVQAGAIVYVRLISCFLDREAHNFAHPQANIYRDDDKVRLHQYSGIIVLTTLAPNFLATM